MSAVAKQTRHIVFSPSARGSLLQALKMLGRQDDVVALFDDLCAGPIDPLDPKARERWFDEVLRVDYEPGFIPLWHEEFWAKALDPVCRLVAWTTLHATQDRVGFLAWASRLGDLPGEVVDISDVVFESRNRKGETWRGRLPVPLVTPANFVKLGLPDLARAVTAMEREEAGSEMRRLGAEGGAFRAIRAGRVVSLPITAFDDALIACASNEYRKAALVIGTVLSDMNDRDDWSVGDLALAARLCAVVESGRLEAQGDIYGAIRFWEVRLPQRRD